MLKLKDNTFLHLGSWVHTTQVADEFLHKGCRGQVVEIRDAEPRICFQYGGFCDECWVTTESCSQAGAATPVSFRSADCFF